MTSTESATDQEEVRIVRMVLLEAPSGVFTVEGVLWAASRRLPLKRTQRMKIVGGILRSLAQASRDQSVSFEPTELWDGGDERLRKLLGSLLT